MVTGLIILFGIAPYYNKYVTLYAHFMLRQSNLFLPFQKCRSITYQGTGGPKLLKFEITNEEEIRPLYLSALVAKENKQTWQAFQDLLNFGVRLGQENIQGLYGLDVIITDIQSGIRHFNPKEFGQLLVNHSRTMTPGQKTIIRFGQVFSVLHKRVPADWGKIEIDTHVEIFNKEPSKIDLHLKKIIESTPSNPNAIYLIQDLSANPLWNAKDEGQNERMRILFQKLKGSRGNVPNVMVFDSKQKTTQIEF